MKIKDKDEASSPQPEKVFYDNRIKRKNVLALNEKVAAIREYEKMPVYKRIGRMFHCSPDQIKRIVQQKDTILKAWEQRTRRCQDAKTLELKVVRVSMLGKAVYDWIRRMMYYKDIMITDGLIQKMALQFKSAMGLQNFFPHQEWCDKFRNTYKIETNDSKLLNIGYTQGYSVQIKDVMKDVLSECSPDSETDDEMRDSLDDGDDDDDGNDDERGNYNDIVHKDFIKKEPTMTLKSCSRLTLVGSNNNTGSNGASNHNTSNSNNLKLVKALHQQQQQHQRGGQITALSLPQLQPMRQLVALPIQTNGIGGMAQKVLVATPITQTNLQRAGVSVGGGGSTGAPMTMTIIPLTTLAQTQPQCAQTANATTGTGTRKSGNERPLVPPPIVEIKKEIKKEPEEEEEVYIKQEYISDDETTTEVNRQITQQTTLSLRPTAAAELPEGAAVKVNIPRKSNDSSLLDDDNLALASLRQLIRKPDNAIGSTTRTARTKQMTLKSPLPLPSPTPTPTSAFSSTSTATTTLNLNSISTSTSASNSTSTSNAKKAQIVRTTPTSTSTSTNAYATTIAATRSTNKRKRRGSETPALSPIKSCSEARRYLKLLEDFALFKGNFRLIGLITRADEVLRELDGDDDVDID